MTFTLTQLRRLASFLEPTGANLRASDVLAYVTISMIISSLIQCNRKQNVDYG